MKEKYISHITNPCFQCNINFTNTFILYTMQRYCHVTRVWDYKSQSPRSCRIERSITRVAVVCKRGSVDSLSDLIFINSMWRPTSSRPLWFSQTMYYFSNCSFKYRFQMSENARFIVLISKKVSLQFHNVTKRVRMHALVTLISKCSFLI